VARSYRRDSRGRFSGGGGGGGRATGGSLAARSSARRSAAKLAGKDAGDSSLSGTLSRRAQKAAVTRTGKAARTARAANRTKLAATSQVVIRPGKARDPVISKAASKARSLRDQADKMLARGNSLMGGGRRDGASVNVSLGSRARTNQINAGLKGLEVTRKAESLRNRADRIELRAAQSVAKAKREADKPKRTRTDESKRLNRAKQIEKRRSINISNPASWRADAAGRMAANAARTQQRAMEFYGSAKPRRRRKP
jgi:hypothetical protein